MDDEPYPFERGMQDSMQIRLQTKAFIINIAKVMVAVDGQHATTTLSNGRWLVSRGIKGAPKTND